jgi:hypothetical protein
VVAGQYPRLQARITPAPSAASARLYFRAAGGSNDWYFVEIKPEGCVPSVTNSAANPNQVRLQVASSDNPLAVPPFSVLRAEWMP